ncbi:uncharacterized protein LOC131033660 [Cryptomeria japonica]|uniref:uncharacterized protein LOC131033660 n=1 Tax=Cryptomeria japonica TaxID=3369 RepID=UPI0027D9D472|nr:uncharacterized protein LOC131033660 [Cryptomeria japonica]
MAFKGVTVYLSRSLVAPESFDALHDALRYNGADICFCSDPSANSPNQYHIISSSDHEKHANLSAKGCNLVGPECVLRCAKEHRSFPKQGYTCCLAMDGVKVLASGFENEEKVKIEKLVTAMCGELYSKTSLDIDFLVAKDVLSAKYKWALNVLRKPVVTIEWLYQCWREHRLVPHEPYRMLPFSGLTICATGIPPDERKKIEGLIIQYGGQYSADLTKKCSHLLCNIAEGAKYKVARRWGHVKILNQKWVPQSISAKACLDEELYPVISGGVASTLPFDSLSRKPYQEEKDVLSLHVPATAQSSLSQPLSSTPSNTTALAKEKSETVNLSAENISENTGCIDGGSQNEENDLYLESCRIMLVGFEHVEMRKLVRMVWSGGGSRYMSFNEKLTHIIVGRPSEIEMKEIRKLTMWGVVNAVKPLWLEDCTRSRREVDVSEKHIFSEKTSFHGIESHKRPKSVVSNLSSQEQNCIASLDNSKSGSVFIEKIIPLENQSWEACNNESLNTKASLESNLNSEDASGQKSVLQEKMNEMNYPNQSEFGCASVQHTNSSVSKTSNVFKGCRFGFSKSFPENLKNEIVAWVHQGGGFLVDDAMNKKVDYIIERHGSRVDTVSYSPHATFVSSHWIRYCLEEGSMLDVGSHILYKPVTCQIPLAGFESMRFSVSQYEEKDRILLRNLCYILGAKFTGKLNKKVTHLLCLYAGGPKYEAACTWGIEAITADWIYECVKQNKVLSLHAFRPREMPGEDGNVRSFDMTQYPAQVAHLASGELPSQWQNDSQPGSQSQTVQVGGEKRERSPSTKKTLFGKKTRKQHHPSNGLLKKVSAKIDFGCNSDPWDEQSVRWSQGMEKGCKEFAEFSNVPCERATKPQEKATQDLAKDPLIDNTVEELARDNDNRLYSVKQSVEACSKNGLSNTITMNEHVHQIGRIEDSEATLDVASAIEDLIAQSELLHNDSRTETVDNRNKISQEYPLVSRFREDPSCTTFRLPKEFSARHENEEENRNISNDVAHKAHEDFSESQMESQVIRYEVENTAKKMLMEKIQTRSMTSVRNEGRGQQINNDLARLLNVVDNGGKQKSKRKS